MQIVAIGLISLIYTQFFCVYFQVNLTAFFQYGDETEKKQAYRKIVEELRLQEMQLEALYDKHAEITDSLADKSKLSGALEETIKIYTEQVELQREFHGSATAINIPRQAQSCNFLSFQFQDTQNAFKVKASMFKQILKRSVHVNKNVMNQHFAYFMYICKLH